MADMKLLLNDLVTANHILANENVLDSFGHVSIRHPDKPGHFIMSRARAPQQCELHDLMEFTLDGKIDRPEPAPRQALLRALHPRRALRGAARGDVGRAQPLRQRDPVQRRQGRASCAR